MKPKISLPPDAIARLEMLKKHRIQSKRLSDSVQLLDQERRKASVTLPRTLCCLEDSI